MTSRLRASGRIAFGLALLVTAGGAVFAASAYIEQTQSTGAIMGQPATSSVQRMWLSDSLVCIQDVDKGVVFVIRGDKVYIVQESEKSYNEMTLEQFTAMADAASAMIMQMSQGQEVKASLEKTDQVVKIGEWDATKHILSLTGPIPLHVSLWYTEDAGINMTDWPKLVELLPGKGAFGDAIQKLTELKGFPVKQESTVSMAGMTMTQTTEVTKVQKGDVSPPEVCGPPESFTGTKGMPGMPQMPGQP